MKCADRLRRWGSVDRGIPCPAKLSVHAIPVLAIPSFDTGALVSLFRGFFTINTLTVVWVRDGIGDPWLDEPSSSMRRGAYIDHEPYVTEGANLSCLCRRFSAPVVAIALICGGICTRWFIPGSWASLPEFAITIRHIGDAIGLYALSLDAAL